jgi:heat shock protein HslJ
MTVLLFALAMAAAQPAPASYQAHGVETDWTLSIGNGRLRYAPADGAAIDVQAPRARISDMSREYQTSRLSVSIHPGWPCTDRASGRRYADTVWLHVGRTELRGCGGAMLAADDLTHTSWAFVEIDGAAVTPTMSSYSLDFGPDIFLGYSRCNRFSGHYARADGRLTFRWIGSTMSRCPAPHDGYEIHLRRIFSGQAGPVQVSSPDTETLLLSADVTIRLRRLPDDN